jgi:arylsulfatase A-like enzyme
MIVRWPGRVPAGAVSDQVPTLLGQTQTNQHTFLYWEFHEKGSKQAVRMGDWKAVRLEPGQPLELYDLKNDVGEKKNVASQHPEVVAEIEAYLKTARTESERWPLRTAAEAAQMKLEPKDAN